MQTSPICDSGKEDHLRISNKINLHGLLALITGFNRVTTLLRRIQVNQLK